MMRLDAMVAAMPDTGARQKLIEGARELAKSVRNCNNLGACNGLHVRAPRQSSRP